MTAVFAQHAYAYADAGLPVFPVDTRNKRPAIRGWQQATPRKARSWARNPRLGNAAGLGVVMGEPSGLVEVDVDAVGDAWLAAAIERFGETPVTVRTASGKWKLWYRHNGEGRHIRPIKGQPIDILGCGFTVAPPSWREDLATAYTFRNGGLEAISALPGMCCTEDFSRVATAVYEGERNNTLWRYCMTQARHCDDVEALIDAAATWSGAFPNPLTRSEINACARSAWRYEANGRNYLGFRKPQLNEGDKIMDALLDCPEAFTLYQLFARWHGYHKSFAIAPTAMSEAGNPPWPRRKIELARDVLLERDHLEEISAPDKFRRKTGKYRLLDYGKSANNHYTPSPR